MAFFGKHRKMQADQTPVPRQGLVTRIGLSLGIIIAGAAAVIAGQVAGQYVAPVLLAPIEGLTELQTTLVSYVIIQAITIGLLLGMVRLVRANAEQLGLGGIKNWTYLLLLPLIYIGTLMLSGAVSLLVAQFVPSFDVEQAQNLGLPDIQGSKDLVTIGLFLVVIVPLAEEFIFRGYLFGLLRRNLPFIATALIVSVLFGLAHGQWNVGIVTFILSLALCFIREKTGSIWTGVALHGLQNCVAFLLLYVFDVI